jgi:hypothetical protein
VVLKSFPRWRAHIARPKAWPLITRGRGGRLIGGTLLSTFQPAPGGTSDVAAKRISPRLNSEIRKANSYISPQRHGKCKWKIIKTRKIGRLYCANRSFLPIFTAFSLDSLVAFVCEKKIINVPEA